MVLHKELALTGLRIFVGLMVLKELFRRVRFRRAIWIGLYARSQVRDAMLTLLGVASVFFTAGLFTIPMTCVFSAAYYFLHRETFHKKLPKTEGKSFSYRVVAVTFGGKMRTGFEPFTNQFEGRTKGADADMFPEFTCVAREVFMAAEQKLKISKDGTPTTEDKDSEKLRFLFAFAEDIAELCRLRLKQPAAKLIFQIMTPSLEAKETYYRGFSSGEGWQDAFQIEFTGMKAVRLNTVQGLTGF